MRIFGIAIVGLMVGLVLAGGLTYHYILDSSDQHHETISYKQNLPPKPDDFTMMQRAIKDGHLPPANLSSAYWLQPDFYPNWDKVIDKYTNHDYSRWGVYGHGAYPANPTAVFKNRSVGTWLELTTLYRTGYGIETWQGVKLTPEDNEYFEVNINPDKILLPPTFPTFSKDWVRKINIKATIKKEPPAGIYTININSGQVNKELADKWYWKILRKGTTKEEKQMIDIAETQAKLGNKPPEKFKRWITTGRKNKYVDSGLFSLRPRIALKIRVE